MMSIEEAIGRLKIVDGDEPQPLSVAITVGGKSRSSMATNHNLSQGLSPSVESYMSLGNSERPARVTGRRGSPLPQWAVESAASHVRHAEAPRLGREDVPRVASTEAPTAAPPATRSQHETMPTTTVASLAIGPRSVDSHDVEEEEPALLLTHASIELSPAASTAVALIYLDEPRAHALIGDGSSNNKTDGWCLNIGATHHMISRREFFTELDFDVRGFMKFGDASGVEIKGISSIIFTAKSGEHRLLTGVYYIPALRNSIISLGQLDESGLHVEIKDRVMRISDHHHRLLAKVTRGNNRL
jgi:hypothetical protein